MGRSECLTLSLAGIFAMFTLAMACTPTQVGGDPAGQPIPDVTPTPDHILITGRGLVPPNYRLRWTAPAGVTVQSYQVYRSTSAITAENQAAALFATVTAPPLNIMILPDSGSLFFRVAATLTDGTKTPLSPEYQLDTTRRVVYHADATQDEVFELYTAPLSGGTPLTVNGVLTTGRSVRDFAWSPDARFVAFTADPTLEGRIELFIAPGDGSGSPRLMSGALIDWANVTTFAWSPDATQLAFISDRRFDGVYDLYVAPIATGIPRIVSTLRTRGDGYDGVRQFAWSPDASQIAYTQDAFTDDLFELFVADLPFGSPRRVSGAMAKLGGSGDGVSDFAWSLETPALAYLANSIFPETRELFVVASAGGAAQRLSGPIVSGGTVHAFAWSPDATQIAYLADKSIPGITALYAVAADGTTTRTLSSPLLSGTQVTEFAWSRDAKRLAFRGDIEIQGIPALYAVDADGTDRTRVTGPLVANTTIESDWTWSPDSKRIAFRGTYVGLPNTLAFFAAADGSGVTPAVPTLLPDRRVSSLFFTADAASLLYLADQDLPGQRSVFVAPANAATGISQRFSGFLPLAGQTFAAAASPLSSDEGAALVGLVD